MRWRRQLAVAAALLVLGGAIHLALVDFYLEDVVAEGIAARTQAQYDQVRERVKTLILGNSHAKWGIAASELDDAFNLALGGQTAPETYYVLRSELEDPAVDPRTVILSVDALTFSDWRGRALPFRYWYAHRVDYLAIGWQRGEPLRFAVNAFLGLHAPYVGRRDDILFYFATGRPVLLTIHIDREMELGSFLGPAGWAKLSESEREAMARDRILRHFPHPVFDEVAGAYFRKTLELARDEGVSLIVVRFPETTEYFQASRDFVQRARVEERLATMLADHPEVTVVDARLDYAAKPKLFMDPDHLSGRGARRFTRRLRRVVEAGEG
jgi:hypothetical protein